MKIKKYVLHCWLEIGGRRRSSGGSPCKMQEDTKIVLKLSYTHSDYNKRKL
jgi:hypothetical protein